MRQHNVFLAVTGAVQRAGDHVRDTGTPKKWRGVKATAITDTWLSCRLGSRSLDHMGL